MSLKKQIFITIIILFVLLCLGTFFVSTYYARAYLSDQLESNAQDTATSLGLSLTTLLKNNDKATMLAMVEAIFNRGYYINISIVNQHGKIIIQRYQPISVYSVPKWYVRLIHLKSPTAKATIMSGWQQEGEVRVTAHPGFAYAQLWHNMRGFLLWFLLLTLLLITAAYVVLYKILKPIKKIEMQARAICDKNFVQEELPRIKELQPVVQAMNKMSLKIKEIIQQQTLEIDQLSRAIYIDEPTHFYTRRYLYNLLNKFILDRRQFITLSVAVIEIDGIEKIRLKGGFYSVVKALQPIAVTIKQICPEDVVKVRLHNNGFGLVFINSDPEECLKELIKALNTILDLPIYIGCYQIRKKRAVGEIMSACDNAIKQGRMQGQKLVLIREAEDSRSFKSAEEWLCALDEAIEKNKFVLYYQPVKDLAENKIIHFEAFLRIKEKEDVFYAAQFFPFAEHFGKADLLDKFAIHNVLVEMDKSPALLFAINLSQQFVQDEECHFWLEAFLKQHQTKAHQFIFEISQPYINANFIAAKSLILCIKKGKAQFGIDNFGYDLSDYHYVPELSPDYLKISKHFAEQVLVDETGVSFVNLLIKMVHNLDCKVIACHIENEQQVIAFRKLKVDALQGYFIGETAVKPIRDA